MSWTNHQMILTKEPLHKRTVDVVGFSVKRNKVWFDENDPEVERLLQTKRSCYQRVLTNPENHRVKEKYKSACINVQRKLRGIQHKWWQNIVVEVQGFAGSSNSGAFYQALKVYGTTYQAQVPVCAADGLTLLTKSVLSKDLNFVPIAKRTNEFSVKRNLEKFLRRVQLKAFSNDKSNSNSSEKDVFQTLNNRKSKWTPPDG